jgi:hypothetical protein
MMNKQVKAQQDIMKESIQKLSHEIREQQTTSFSEFCSRQEAAFSSLPEMIAKAVEEALKPRTVTKRKRDADASTDGAKLQHTNPSGEADGDLEMTEEEVSAAAIAPTTLVPPPAGDAGGGEAN